MFRSLWFRLVGTLAIVTGIALIVVTITANVVTARQFEIYAIRSGEIWAAQVAPVLAEQYRQDGDWSQAQDALVNPWHIQSDNGSSAAQGMGGGMMGPGARPGGPPLGAGGGNMWRMMNIHLLVLDSAGKVVADSQGVAAGQVISPEIIQYSTPVTVDGKLVGVIVAVPADVAERAELNRNFLATVNRSVILAALASGAAALVLGTLLFRRITKPLGELKQAARTVEAGELAARVPVASRDELGMVAEAFNQMTARLEKQQQLRKQMVADIAHDLRTPLSVMQATIEAIQDGVLKPNQKELRSLHGEIRRLTRLVEDLRTLSLADEGQLKLELLPVDVAVLVEQVVTQMATLAESREVTLRAQISGLLPIIQADGDRLIEVLTNLLDNALRYTPANGAVAVEAVQAGQQVRISVKDSGAGIPDEDIPFVFERFWRSDKSRSRDSGGSGMGLAIARQLVELHGGTIRVESKAGEGTTFTFLLPIAPAS